MAITGEYEKLLRYFESEKSKSSAKSSSSLKFEKVDTLKEAIDRIKKPKKQTKKEKIKTDTKKILEESQIDQFKDIPSHRKKLPSKGFDVEQFESLMRSKLIEEHKTRQSYERPYISCSELYVCMRQTYYSRKRYQINVKAQYRFSYLYLIQKVGNVIHDIFQELYNFTEVEKTVVSEKYKVKGRIDAIQEYILYEIKSIDAEKYTGKYQEVHYIQSNIYAHILTTEYDHKIKNISLIYVLRNLKKVYVFDLEVDHELAKKYLERAPILLKALDDNKIPETIGASKDQCRYCSYKKYCEKDGYDKIVPPYIKKKQAKKEEKKSVFLI
ncbi:MAG: CRISPR-associated protein Cas4 [Candidatus Heimdallarchaeaceae archaeon]